MTTIPSDVLLSFVGSKDPCAHFHGRESEGPLLTLCKKRSFQRIVLFHTKDTDSGERARKTAEYLSRSQAIGTGIEVVSLAITDPSQHGQILLALRGWWEKQTFDSVCEFYISIASGTPAMHACWLLLAAADEIHANILYVRDPSHVNPEQPSVGEINPRAPEFPVVSSRVSMSVLPKTSPELSTENLDEHGLFGSSPAFLEAASQAARFAPCDYPVLLLGETGTGKERFAQFIHKASKRARGPFLAINCSSLPETLVESELFGHRRGAFTGADMDKKGAFEEADGGTLFLDEIGDMPLRSQSKLLRALQEHSIRPLGGTDKKVDVRIIAATHHDLNKAQKQGTFREDLFHRLNVLHLKLPALRDRRQDIIPLAEFFLARENRGAATEKRFTKEFLENLKNQAWDGNIRELEHAIMRAVVLADGDEIRPCLLSIFDDESCDNIPLPHFKPGFSLTAHLDEYRTRIYAEALRLANNNFSEAGRLLGVSSEAVRKGSTRQHQLES